LPIRRAGLSPHFGKLPPIRRAGSAGSSKGEGRKEKSPFRQLADPFIKGGTIQFYFILLLSEQLLVCKWGKWGSIALTGLWNPQYSFIYMSRFWEKLNKPILALAPMAGITDSPFRQICRELGADVVYSEMVCADALYYDSKKTMNMLAISKKEHPVVVQLFGKRPELFGKAAKIVQSAGADGIDINFGCPAKKVVRHGGGVALMRDLKLSREIIEAVVEVASVPVSVKIRSGIRGNTHLHECAGNTNERELKHESTRIPDASTRRPPLSPPCKGGGLITAVDFVKNILDLPIAAIMVHGRTYEQGFSGEPDYEMIRKVVELVRDSSTPLCCGRNDKRQLVDSDNKIRVLANGGIKSVEDAKRMLDETGADGIGIAQGVLGRPWLFREIREKHEMEHEKREKEEIKKIALRHAKLAYKMKGDHGIVEMRKHLLWYVKGWENAKELRSELVKVQTVEDIEEIFNGKN